MSAAHWLSKNLSEGFGITDDAHDWLMELWGVIQVFDDMADGDFPARDELLAALVSSLCTMPANPFFRAFQDELIPLMAVAILKWKASDDAERAGEAGAMSYAWRAGFYDIVLAVVRLVHGDAVAMEAAQHVMRLYGETFDDYQREFRNA